MGGTSYFIVDKDAEGQPANLLIDSPPVTSDLWTFLQNHGGVEYWIMTHRGAIGEVKQLQSRLQRTLIIQEQEAYLLPDIPGVIHYKDNYPLTLNTTLLWTPGHSPGSTCLYYNRYGGILFTGRHLLPNQQGRLMPLRFSKTFHWPRQLRSVSQLQTQFSTDTLAYICPAANTGFLRGKYAIQEGYAHLRSIDVTRLLDAPILL